MFWHQSVNSEDQFGSLLNLISLFAFDGEHAKPIVNPSAAYFSRQLQVHLNSIRTWSSKKSGCEFLDDLSATLDIGAVLGWPNTDQIRMFRKSVNQLKNDCAEDVLEIAIDDVKLLQPLQRGRLLPGVACRLLMALRNVQDPSSLENHSGLESLLRHVEVKRARCCMSTLENQTNEQRYLDRHRVALAFLMVSRKNGALRFLNAALKLNEWPAASHSRMRPSPCTAKWLHALALQELVVQEIFT